MRGKMTMRGRLKTGAGMGQRRLSVTKNTGAAQTGRTLTGTGRGGTRLEAHSAARLRLTNNVSLSPWTLTTAGKRFNLDFIIYILQFENKVQDPKNALFWKITIFSYENY